MANPMRSFASRSKHHDELALPYVANLLRNLGFTTIPFGTELDEGYRSEMARHQDEYSRSMRHRPDMYVVHPIYSYLTYDVKSEWQGYPNFAIEADSLKYIQNYPGSIFVMVDMPKGKSITEWKAVCCWAADITPDISESKTIWVPTRSGYQKDFDRMKKAFPTAEIKKRPPTCGSGTPYMLVSKRNKLLRPLEDFIKTFLFVEPEVRQTRQLPRQMLLSDQRIQF